jgi:hypothetical protein
MFDLLQNPGQFVKEQASGNDRFRATGIFSILQLIPPIYLDSFDLNFRGSHTPQPAVVGKFIYRILRMDILQKSIVYRSILAEGKAEKQREIAISLLRRGVLNTRPADNGCLVLEDGLAYLECTVQNRIEAGDRWLIYAVVDQGEVLDRDGTTAIHYRKTAVP